MKLIDYGHVRDGVLFHGSVSNLDGPPKSRWTVEAGERTETHEAGLDEPTFEALWNGIATLDAFRRAAVHDPDQPINPASHHVVGVVYLVDGNQGQALFLVPADESDPDFHAWLRTLDVPAAVA